MVKSGVKWVGQKHWKNFAKFFVNSFPQFFVLLQPLEVPTTFIDTVNVDLLVQAQCTVTIDIFKSA